MMKKNKINNKAAALVFVISLIALLLVITVGLIMANHYDMSISFNIYNTLRVQQLADAGIQRAIGEIEKDARNEFVDDKNDVWYSPSLDTAILTDCAFSDNTLLGGLGRYDVWVVDCQRQVNINTASANLLSQLPGIDAALAAAIIAGRPYETKRQLLNVSGIAEATYDNLKDYITVISWQDASCNNRSPININTADEFLIKAVLKGTGLSDTAVNTAYTALSSAISMLGPFYSWTDFDNVIDSTSLSATDKQIIKDNANPNRLKPANNTTEFCFFSGGYYEITSVGRIYETTNQNNIAAQRTVNTVIQVFKTIAYTTKEDFRGEDANYNLTLDAGEDTNGNGVLDVPVYQRVTWQDSCPVNGNCLFDAHSICGPEYKEGALKIGYWDDFDEDVFYSQSQWVGDYSIVDADGDGEAELYYATATSWPYPVFTLNDAYRWTWQYYALRVYEYDGILPWQMKEVGWVMCGTDLSSGNNVGIHLAYPGPLEWGGIYYRNVGGTPAMSSNPAYPLWIFEPQLRRWPDNGDIDNYWCQHPDLPASPLYQRAKTYNLTNTLSWAKAKAFDSAGASSTLDLPQANAGRLSLYGQNQRPIWDDLRIIPESGNYISAVFRPQEGSVEWGSFYSSYILQADTSLTFAVDTGGGFVSVVNNSALNAASNSIKFRINMLSGGTMHNTPIVEDIYITYIIPLKVLYRNEL